MRIYSDSEEKTYHIAKEVAKKLCFGDVVLLHGDLGSGKTTFTKGLAKNIGVQKNITSPTFVIKKQYSVGQNKRLVHVDCYRLSDNYHEIEGVGLFEDFVDTDSLVVLEWPEKIKKHLPKSVKKIYFKYVDENTREIKTDIL